MKFIKNNKYVIGFLVILAAICYAGYSYIKALRRLKQLLKLQRLNTAR